MWRILRSFSDDRLVGRTIFSSGTSSNELSSLVTTAVSVESVATAETVENPLRFKALISLRSRSLVMELKVLTGEWRVKYDEGLWMKDE